MSRAEGGSTKVCVSEQWTLEYDLALSGCARLMHMATGLAVRAKKHDGYLPPGKYEEAIKALEAEWDDFEASKPTAPERACRIYRPLFGKRASKAVTAQYAAALLESGAYGQGSNLANSLPPYLRQAIEHLTGKFEGAKQ